MTNSSLVELIKTLEKKERTDMLKYLQSPVFNEGANAMAMLRLYEVIASSAPDFKEEKLDKDAVYAYVFPDQKPVGGKLEKLMTELSKTLRTALLTHRYLAASNEHHRQIDWQVWLREHNLLDRAQQALQKAPEVRTESIEKYQYDLMLATEAHELQSLNNRFTNDLSIPQLIEQLNLYYLNYKVALENRYISQMKSSNLPELQIPDNNPEYYTEKSILLRISTQIKALLQNDTPAINEFESLTELIRSYETHLSFESLSQFYTYLRNTCSLLINAGHLNFVPVLHQLQRESLDRGLFLINGAITQNVYINLVQIAIRVKDLDWAESVTEKYRNQLVSGDEDRFFYKFNLAHCMFVRKRYDEALEHLPDAPSLSYYHRAIRRLELKVYYEQQSDLLHYKLFAFRKHLERTASKAIAQPLREMDLNFHNILLQLTQSPPKDRQRSTKIIERIQKKQLLSDRAWLLEKAEELGGR